MNLFVCGKIGFACVLDTAGSVEIGLKKVRRKEGLVKEIASPKSDALEPLLVH